VLPKDEFYEEALNEKASDSDDSEAFFIKQSADNLCGSICLIHAVVNGFAVFFIFLVIISFISEYPIFHWMMILL